MYTHQIHTYPLYRLLAFTAPLWLASTACDLPSEGAPGSDVQLRKGQVQPLACPPASFSLDDNGVFEFPDLVGDNAQLQDLWREQSGLVGELLIEQSPAPATVFSSPAQLAWTLSVKDEEGSVAHCETAMTIRDVTPPTIDITGIEEGMRFVLSQDEPPIPVFSVKDAIDPEAVLTVTLDGDTYEPDTPIADPGRHTLRAEAVDQSGNISEIAVRFEVRERPQLTGTIAVADYQCQEQGEYASLDLTVGIAAADFDPYDLNLDTLILWPLNDNGLTLARDTIRVSGVTDPDTGEFTPGSTEAVYEAGFWQLRFEVPAESGALIACPTQVELTGRGRDGAPGVFDLETTRAPTDDISDDLMAYFQAHGLTNDNSTQAPEDKPEAGCEWKARETEGPGSEKRQVGPWFIIRYLAKNFGFSANSFTVSHQWTGGSVNAKSASGVNTDIVDVFLEGICACEQKLEIECLLTPQFEAEASIDPTGYANAAGLIDVHTDTCELHKYATGGVAAGQGGPTSVKFKVGGSIGKDGPQVSTEVETQLELAGLDSHSVSNSFNDVGLKTAVDKRKVTAVVVANGRQQMSADAGYWDQYAEARSFLRNAQPGIRITPTCIDAGVVITGEFKW